MEWTDKQKDVIDTRGRNILVSAAAGSGKTAVLVERIIQKILDAEHPVDVDKLLVVTFTKAAAAEMRERVLEALERASEQNPEDENLQKQQTYIHNAKITTIDSFCAGIVREHFDKIELDPNIRIVDEAEMKLLESDVLEEMLEEYFAKGEASFFRLADKYTDPKNTENLHSLIAALYRAASSHVNPKKWLESCREPYEIEEVEQAEQTSWMQQLKNLVSVEIAGLIEKADEALKICMQEDGPIKYYDDLSVIQKALLRIDCTESYDTIRKAVNSVVFPRIPIIKKDSCDESLKAQVKQIRDKIKENIGKIKKEYFAQSLEEMVSDIINSRETVESLIHLTLDFYDRFAKEKCDKCIMDFCDQEHYALRILVDFEEDGTMTPSMVARELATQYEEIMIDEYQDSNYVQEAILTSVSGGYGRNNVFMVGDVKQSIYKFRLANPNLFIEKYDTYAEDLTKDSCKIILDKNFRSRREIIDSVNFIFRTLMQKELGGIDYENGNELAFGAEYYPELLEEQDNSTELILVDGKGNENEARVVARRIQRFVNPENNFKITRKDGNLQCPQYKDIVILLRSTKGRAEEYVKILSEEGVPAYCESKTGYYEAKEVKTILDYLRVIDNPLQDIPLGAVMRSEMYDFSSEELAIIKAQNETYYFYDCARLYVENGESSQIKEKLHKLFSDVERYRAMVPYTSVYDLITKILEETGYANYIRALPNGVRREKNMDILKEKAISYDTGTYKGLFNFVRYLEKIKELGMEEGEASPVNENDNIVRIMTFHKSKGLQFPIVFVSGLGTKFNNADTTGQLAIHEKYGLGMEYIDTDYHVKKPTMIKTIINKIIKEENYAEYIRFLYVALTRAQEKMVLTASDSKMETKVEAWLGYRNTMEQKVSYGRMMEAGCMADWIGMAVAGNKGFGAVLKQAGAVPLLLHPLYKKNAKIVAGWVREEDIIASVVSEEINESLSKERLISWESSPVYDEEGKKQLERTLSWEYAYQADFKIPAKLSVSEIKKLSMSHNEEEDGSRLILQTNKDGTELIPEFLKDSSSAVITGAERGTAYHKIFEMFDFDIEPTKENLEKMIINLVECGKISKETAACVDVNDFVRFAASDLYRRMKQAYNRKQLFRERSFLMGVYAKDIIQESESDEIILVQGMVDVCFVEEDKVILADYKTDYVQTMEQLLDRYAVQLRSYKEAIDRLEGTKDNPEPVSEMIIYSVKLGDEIKVESMESDYK